MTGRTIRRRLHSRNSSRNGGCRSRKAQAEIKAFAKAVGDQRKTELLAFMAGTFSLLDQERFAVIQGLDRFGARQQSYAAQIRTEIADLHDAQDAGASGPADDRQARRSRCIGIRRSSPIARA